MKELIGALSLGNNNHPLRIGVNSEVIRAFAQNTVAHGWFRPQPGFTPLNNHWLPYYRWGTNSRYSLWW